MDKIRQLLTSLLLVLFSLCILTKGVIFGTSAHKLMIRETNLDESLYLYVNNSVNYDAVNAPLTNENNTINFYGISEKYKATFTAESVHDNLYYFVDEFNKYLKNERKELPELRTDKNDFSVPAGVIINKALSDMNSLTLDKIINLYKMNNTLLYIKKTKEIYSVLTYICMLSPVSIIFLIIPPYAYSTKKRGFHYILKHACITGSIICVAAALYLTFMQKNNISPFINIPVTNELTFLNNYFIRLFYLVLGLAGLVCITFGIISFLLRRKNKFFSDTLTDY